jgi:hypothetical protein
LTVSNNFLSRLKAGIKNIITMILIKLNSFQTLLKQIRKRLKEMEWLPISVHLYLQFLTSLLTDDRFDWSRQTIGMGQEGHRSMSPIVEYLDTKINEKRAMIE